MTDLLEVPVDGTPRAGSVAFDLRKIRKGKASPSQTSSSIPTTFETIINRERREKGGFNKTSPRFPPTRIDDEPGPGSYNTLEVSQNVNKESFSRKGYGNGFVSTTKRFQEDDVERRKRSSCPGPGAYDTEKSAIVLTKSLDANRVASSPFAPRYGEKLSRKKGKQDFQPGPGAYHHEDVRLENVAGSRSVFVSTSKRSLDDSLEKEDHIPPLGTYDVTRYYDSEKSKNGYAAAFKSTSKRGEMVTNQIPGPGHYEVDNKQTKKVSPRKHHHSYLSATVTSVNSIPYDPVPKTADEKSRSTKTTPGPGYYEIEESLKKTQSSGAPMTSVFKSTAAREGHLQVSPAPGPGYYDPPSSPKETFNLNTKNIWL